MALNLHSVACCGQPRLIYCNGCARRAAIPGEAIGAGSGNMKELRTLRLVCSGCRVRNFRMFVVPKPEHVTQFLSGDPLDFFKTLEA